MPKTKHPNLILLDFTEHDTIAALERLLDMANDGQISAMTFSVMLTARKDKRVLLGATGRASRNLIEATGMSAILHCNLTQIAMAHIQEL